MKKTVLFMLMGAAVILSAEGVPASEGGRDQSGIVAAEIATFSRHLSIRPKTAIDLSAVSGEYCFNAGFHSGGQMTHFAIDPEKTKEDVIDFVNADSLVKAGINVADLPKFPGKLGTMKPNQWYFLEAGAMEPHHGMSFPFPVMMRATNLE